jgi:hypothetical protein
MAVIFQLIVLHLDAICYADITRQAQAFDRGLASALSLFVFGFVIWIIWAIISFVIEAGKRTYDIVSKKIDDSKSTPVQTYPDRIMTLECPICKSDITMNAQNLGRYVLCNSCNKLVYPKNIAKNER